MTGHAVDTNIPGYVILRYKAYYLDSTNEEKSVNKINILQTHPCGSILDGYSSNEFIKDGEIE